MASVGCSLLYLPRCSDVWVFQREVLPTLNLLMTMMVACLLTGELMVTSLLTGELRT